MTCCATCCVTCRGGTFPLALTVAGTFVCGVVCEAVRKPDFAVPGDAEFATDFFPADFATPGLAVTALVFVGIIFVADFAVTDLAEAAGGLLIAAFPLVAPFAFVEAGAPLTEAAFP